jgi:pimeloyl-ACP methyl ester carboxylesterase
MLFNPLGRQRRIAQPTLVAQGTADQVVDPGTAGVMAGLLPNARVEHFDGAGHCSTGSSQGGSHAWSPVPRRSPDPRSGTDPGRSPVG